MIRLAALAILLIAQIDVIRVDTRLVQVSVVVRDRNGPIADLRKEDFTLLDNKKPQRIDVFSVLDVRKDIGADLTRLPQGTVSNRLTSDGDLPLAFTVILFDFLNTPKELQPNAIKRLLGYLRTVQRGDRIALYLFGQELRVVQDFTGDPDVLVRTAERIRPLDAAGVELNSVVDVGLDVRSLAALLDPGSTATGSTSLRTGAALANALSICFSSNQATRTTEAFEYIAGHLAGLPGRKNLIWLSAGFPFEPPQIRPNAGDSSTLYRETPVNFGEQLSHASRALNNANVALYPVDVRGVNGAVYPEVMVRLAQATGGRPSYFDNDFQTAIHDAIADGQITYTLGFYSTAKASDQTLHDLVVKVNRSNVEVLHRPGYYPTDTDRPTPGERQKSLSEALISPMGFSEIGLTARAEPDSSRGGAYKVSITVDAADIEFEQQNNRRSATLILATRLESSQDKSVKTETISLNISEEQFRSLLARGFVLNSVISSDGRDRLKVAIQDRATGRTGSIWLLLEP